MNGESKFNGLEHSRPTTKKIVPQWPPLAMEVD